MKKGICVCAALLLALLCLGGALAEKTVQLPESRYRLTVPDSMEYDGPGVEADDSCFALVDAGIGLDISFFRYPNTNNVTLEAMAEVLIGEIDDTAIYRINGIDMIVFRVADPADPPSAGMQCIGYVFLDGDGVQMINFWYATQEAADETAVIIGSITDKE